MSITRLPRELGIILRCSGVEGRPNCKAKLQTAQVEARGIRAYAKTIDWGRGLRKGRKRLDLCSDCMPVERRLLEKQKADWEAEKKRRDEVRKAKWAEKAEAKKAAAAAKPPKEKKPRTKKFSPQDACAEYLPDPSPSAA